MSKCLCKRKTESVHFQDPWSATEEENQEVEVTSALVDSVRAELEHRVRELEELLREAHRECERKTKASERTILNNEYTHRKKKIPRHH